MKEAFSKASQILNEQVSSYQTHFDISYKEEQYN